MKVVRFILYSLCFVACGNQDPQVNLSFTGQGDTALTNANTVDVVVSLTAIQGSNGQILDGNADSVPDTFIFPSTCDSSKAARCGFSLASPQTYSMDGIPLGFAFDILVEFRDSTGQVLYKGTSSFATQSQDQSLSINVVNA